MRILHVGNYSPLERMGGVETVTDAVCSRLAGKGHDVKLLCFGKSGRGDGYEIVGLKTLFMFQEMPVPDLAGFLKILSEVKRAHAVHIHSLTALGAFMATLACIYHGRKFIFTLHSHLGVGEYRMGRSLMYRLATWVYNRLILRFSLSACARIHVPSEGYLMLSEHTSGFQRKDWVIPHGVDLKLLDPKMPATMPGSEPRVLFISSLDASRRGRGLELLIDSMMGVDAKLVIVGDGDLRSLYEDYCRGEGVEADFRGYVERSELAGIINSCTLMAFPTMFPESFGISVAEAMACGLPVIGSDMGGIPYVIGDAGIIVPAGDVKALAGAIRKLLDDNGLRADLSSRCIERARKEFDWDVIVMEYERLYKVLLHVH
ncbi:glycosyltransferase family 4 protein [Candidatus Altiarchaeota archaeon]